MNRLLKLINDSQGRIAFPLAVFPAINLAGCKVIDVVTDARCQFEVSSAIHKRFDTPIVITAMDLSVEGEAFGASVHFSDNEVPTIYSPIVNSESDIASLRIPEPGEKRTSIYLETTSLLKTLSSRPLVFSVMIGPFSLAGRLMGMNEALCMTLTEPLIVHKLLEKCAAFLQNYAIAFKKQGADGLLIAEPAAGLLSPAAVEEFSSNYIRQIVDKAQDDSFSVILHNCAAKIQHLKAKVSAKTTGLHFGAPMDIVSALNSVSDKIICGNLDPTSVFLKATPEETYEKTLELLNKTSHFRNFIISSGCDIPAGTKMENLDAFFDGCKKFVKSPATIPY